MAPLIFPALVEYPLALVAACLLRPAPPKKRPELLEFFLDRTGPTRWMDLGAPLLLGAAVALVLAAARPGRHHQRGGRPGLRSDGEHVAAPASLRAGARRGVPRRVPRGPRREDTLDRDRSFFGVYRVTAREGGRLHELFSGTTLHGEERTGPGRPRPLSYYSPRGPVGQAFRELPRATTARVGGIGLGSGTLGCFARRGSAFTFYEIDKTVVRIARDPRLFSFLRDCAVRPRVVLGDGRRSLERAARAATG